MKRSALLSLSALLCAGLAACAGLNTHLPDISASALTTETQRQETAALQKIESNAAKLLNVGWPVLIANADLCPKVRPSIGVKTHKLKSYPKRLRPAAQRVFGADHTARIFHIAKDGPAAVAGFKRGDIILNDAGTPAKLGSKVWATLLANNVVDVQRGDATLSLRVKPVSTCNYNLRLSGGSVVNAYADGRNITVTSGMMDFVENDAELALIVGHELGHNTMSHIRKITVNFIASLGGTRYTRPFESEADYVGLYYLARAGYPPQGVEAFWKRLATVSPKGINRAKTHPTFPDRYLRIRAAQDEILEKQNANLPVFPNFKTKNSTPET